MQKVAHFGLLGSMLMIQAPFNTSCCSAMSRSKETKTCHFLYERGSQLPRLPPSPQIKLCSRSSRVELTLQHQLRVCNEKDPSNHFSLSLPHDIKRNTNYSTRTLLYEKSCVCVYNMYMHACICSKRSGKLGYSKIPGMYNTSEHRRSYLYSQYGHGRTTFWV